MADKQPDFNFTTSHRVSYADILEPRSFQKKGMAKGDPRYSGTFLINANDPDLAKLKAEVTALLQTNNKTGKKLKIGRLTEEQERTNTHIEVQVPWKSGDKEADRMAAAGKDGEVFRGQTLLKASSKYQPALAALDAGKLLEFSTPESIAVSKKYFYSGAYMVPSVGLHYYKGDAGKPDGVSLYLNAVMFAKHGPRLGGRSVNAAETFKGYIGSIKDEDPTGGAEEELDDAAGF
jgi:hypothetical protein